MLEKTINGKNKGVIIFFGAPRMFIQDTFSEHKQRYFVDSSTVCPSRHAIKGAISLYYPGFLLSGVDPNRGSKETVRSPGVL